MSAVSQADSPESNPNSPLPVTALLVQYTNNELIGQKLEWFSSIMSFDQLFWIPHKAVFCIDLKLINTGRKPLRMY